MYSVEVGDATQEIRSELQRIVRRLAVHLSRQRERGRTPDTEPVPGFAIDHGEAEGLVSELFHVFGSRTGVDTPVELEEIESPSEHVFLNETPVFQIVRAFDLTPAEYDAVLLALGVEIDGRFARLIAYLNDDVGRSRPTLGLGAALAEPEATPCLVTWLDRPFIRDGLIELEGDGPLSGLAMRIAPPFVRRLLDGPEPEAVGPDRDVRSVDELVLAPPLRTRIERWMQRSRLDRETPRIVVAGEPGSGRSTVAHALLQGLGYRAIEHPLPPPGADDPVREARREARWRGAALVLRVPPQWDAAAVARGCASATLPIALVATPGAAAELVRAVPGVVSFEIPAPEIRERVGLWHRLLAPPQPATAVLDELAAGFRFGPVKIARAIVDAGTEHELSGATGSLPRAALISACRNVGAASMPASAQRLPVPFSREELVLPKPLLEEIDLAAGWIRSTRTVFEHWGFGQRVPLGRGLTALFAGAPGTGKTMTAQILARELALDIYRVDLSSIMSKYIGETEKNLAKLYDGAQDCGGILFFDEADALFGRRSEVRDARDRYANVEIGYLLQRMEEHEGVTVLATNRLGDLDEAFIRRFHILLRFPMPGVADRLRLWQGLLLPGVPGSEAIRDSAQLVRLAEVFEVSGGEIRNAVLAAAFMAATQGQPLAVPHLKRALGREFQKSGRVLDQRQRRELEANEPGRAR